MCEIDTDAYTVYFMLEGEAFEIKFEPANEATGYVYIELLTCFAKTVGDYRLQVTPEQQVSEDMKSKVSSFVDTFSPQQPQLNRLSNTISKLAIGNYFLLLPYSPTDSSEKLKYELYLTTLNEVGNNDNLKELFEEKIKLFEKISHDLLQYYDISNPRTDKRIIIGNKTKSKRCCRFCNKTLSDGATFSKVAHAIPEGLGNKNIILADECDSCNEFFGCEIEPALIEYLDIYRAILGIKGKKGIPKLKFGKDGIYHSNGKPIIESQNIEKISDSEVKVHFETSKIYVPVKIYKALCKITISTIDTNLIPELEKTVNWLISKSSQSDELPKIAMRVFHAGFTTVPQVVNYIRKDELFDVPHIVSEFRIGSYVFVYIVPYSNKDQKDFSEELNYNAFWSMFHHYSAHKNWQFQRFDSNDEAPVKETIHFKSRTEG